MKHAYTRRAQRRGPIALAIATALGAGVVTAHAGEAGDKTGPSILLLAAPENEFIDVESSAAAVDADGDGVVVWSVDREDADNNFISRGIYFRRVASNGAASGVTAVVETTDETFDIDDADVAMDADGDFVVVWSQAAYGEPEIVVARRFAADGSAAGGAITVSQGTDDSENSHVAMDAAGNFVVVWEDDYDGAIHFRRFGVDGTALGNAVAANTTALDPVHPAIAVGAKGDFVIAWEAYDSDETGIYARRFAANGDPLDDEFLVNVTEAEQQHGPRVAVDVDGDFAVGWTSYLKYGYGPPVGAVLVRRFAADGTPLTDEIMPASMSIPPPRLIALAFDADGDVLVDWHGEEYFGGALGAARIDADGNSELRATNFESGGCGIGTASDCDVVEDVAIDADGDRLIAFSRLNFYDKYDQELHAQRIQGPAEINLAATLSASDTVTNPGDELVLSVEVENLNALSDYYGIAALDNAVGAASGVHVQITAPESFEVTATSEGWTCEATDAAHLACFASATLIPATDVTLEITLTMPDAEGAYPVYASVGANQSDSDSTDNDAQLVIAVAALPVDDDGTPVQSGGGGGGALGWLGLLLLPFGVGGRRRRT